MRMLPFVLFLSAFLSLFVALPARAQDAPAFMMPQMITTDEVEALSVDFDEAFAMFENGYLSDMVKLQYQISLLEKMVARQAELQKISESFESMGASFTPPSPPRGICAQLPANAACLKAYPDLYPELVNKRKAYYAELAAKARAANPAAIQEGETAAEAKARIAKLEAARRIREAKAERKTRYQWTEVTCVAGQCHGVLVAPKMSGYRVTVRDGVKLPDGTLIQNVSADGVTVSIDGERIALRPAPSSAGQGESGGSGADSASLGDKFFSGVGGGADMPAASGSGAKASDATSAAAAVVANIDGSGNKGGASGSGGAASSASSSKDASSGNAAATGQTVAEPALGPSGLF